MVLCFLTLPAGRLLAQDRPADVGQKEKPAGGETGTRSVEDRIFDKLVAQIGNSARTLHEVEPPSERILKPLALAPGAPPLLIFRYFDGKQRHRFGNLDLVMDDAGH